MKKQIPKFKEGDVVRNPKNNFKRIIRKVAYVENDETSEVRYFYSEDKVDASFNRTGHFHKEITGHCSQNTLLDWQRGK
jgi:hypothetical protein